jgi:parallel beta-helix repeat protein
VPTTSTTSIARATLLALAVAASSIALAPSSASAATTCAKWAATSGSDLAAGTAAAPYRSLAKLVSALQPGETGCLPAGQTYEAIQGNGIVRGGAGTAALPVTITSGPGVRATVRGAVLLAPASHDVVLTGLDVRGGYTGPGYDKGTLLKVEGDRVAIVANDISNPRGICIGAGRAHETDPTVNEVAENLRITHNRIHDCGMDPALTWSVEDSGSHGIYLENTLRARVADNLVYRNRFRGLQLWPRNDGAVVENNLFDENSTHVNIGSSIGPNGGFVAQNTTVRGNLFTGRVTTFWTSKNPSQLYGYFPAGSPTYGNVVSGNCFAPGDATATGNGYVLGTNTVTQAQFQDRTARDYRLVGTACLGYGPASIQPGTTAGGHAVTVSAPGSGVTGDAVAAVVTVRNGTASARTLTIDLGTSPGLRLLAPVASTGSCTGTTCTASVPASGSVQLTATLGVTAGGTQSVTAAIRETDTTPADNRATATITGSGPACTFVGTQAAETVEGTAGDDVLCLFGGNDTALPAGGQDIVIGGAGTDRLSYSNAGNAVTINFTQGAAWDSAGGTIGWDRFLGIEAATGSAFGDTVVGSAAAEILDGLEGADQMWGYGGNDVLKGWSGDDRLYGGDGDDSFDGGEGVDTCNQGLGTGTKVTCEA